MNCLNIHMILILATISVLLVSCEKELSVSPEVEEKLVVHAFIAPQDSLIEVAIASTISPLGDTRLKNRPVKNAIVYLSQVGDSSTIQLRLADRSDNDRINGWSRYNIESSLFPLIPGKNYRLKVSTPSGLSAEAECTLPEKQVDVTSISVHKGNLELNGRNYTRFNVKWPDFPDENNYYSWSAVSYLNIANDSQVVTNEFVTQYLSDISADEQGIITSNNRSIPLEEINYQLDSSYIDVYVAHTDQQYYNYHLDLIRQSQFENNEPNISSPVPIDGNILGGIGVFAGYNLTVKRVYLSN